MLGVDCGAPSSLRGVVVQGAGPHLYGTLPTWRVLALDDVLFVSVFSDDAEGHRSPMYRITRVSSGGAVYRGFRRHLDEVRRTARRVV